MAILIMVLRIVHIFSGVFWVGFAFFNIGFLQPTVKATGAEGQKMMQYLTQKTRLLSTVYTTTTLTMLSGLIMYWILSGFRLTFISSGYGFVLTIGSIAGIIAWIYAVVVIRGIFNRMQTIGQEIQAQGSPPTPEQATHPDASPGCPIRQSRTDCAGIPGHIPAGDGDSAIRIIILAKYFIEEGVLVLVPNMR
jgi:uncharacterized membrane protein